MKQPISSTIPTLAIVMPALNEEDALRTHLPRLLAHPAIQALPVTSVIVVDNGSTDGTTRVAQQVGAAVVSEPRRGYGWACLAGVQAAKGAEVVLLMDADGSDDLAGAASVAALVLSGDADLAMGSRTRGTAERGALTLQQHAGNAVGTMLLRTLYGVHVSDIGPTRAIRRDALLALGMREMGYGWSTEMLAKAARSGLRIREVPVNYHRRAGGNSKVAGTLSGTLKASLHILRTLNRYRHWQPGATAMTTTTSTNARTCRDALFITARLPVPGQTKTRLGAVIGHHNAASLYAAFLRDLGARFTAAAIRAGYDLYWYYTAPANEPEDDFAACVPAGGAFLRQPSGEFAARLRFGFESLAQRGYERVVVLGSDSPHVPGAWVTDAFAALDSHDVVIGPARDGGYYLLGQNVTRVGPANLFTGIEMSTPRVYHETIARAHAASLSVAHAPTTFDVDDASDLKLLCDVVASAPCAEADTVPATHACLSAIFESAPARQVSAIRRGVARAGA